ncbi:PLP-dependent aminotransferase family protein [Iamia sp. SCSIO 61187]|uniref:aminotransferase-like domain-containing protein n=1 Tax=Iamia sp. SCSIO 61187 TaxID=2722752 RepID=UPI001C626E03|nr:PLP-dependent aminotransferase family protein [Iamia sp. SCSIO 61187]QYG93741.1 PLP-dependent aminotransferase family protein [Iamia sp. SCSIO 61187]
MDGIDLFLDEVATARHRDIQFTPHTDRLDLTWGHPDPTLLPVDELRTATDAVLSDRGWRALSYGTSEGSGRLRHALAERLAVHAPTTSDDLIVTYGSSHALDLVLAQTGYEDDVVLVEQPTYFLALEIIAERRMRAVGLPARTPAADSLADTVGRVRAGDPHRRIYLYLSPTHGNPTGRTMPEDERRTLVEVARDNEVTIIEDDVYGELGDEPVTPLWALDPERVIRLGSFSKTIAPGLRLGFVRVVADAAEMATNAVLHSGGGANPLVAGIVAELIESGAYDRIVGRLGRTYRERMAVLLGRIDDAHLPAGRPTAGYFAWIKATEGDLVAAAAEVGVALAAPGLFCVDPVGPTAARASCSLLGPADLAEASARLAGVLGSGGPGDRP